MIRWVAALALFVSGCGAEPEESPEDCAPEGDGYNVKVLDLTPCCEGLTAVNTSLEPDDDGVCQEVTINPARVCIACGDGTCDGAENTCNCPDDCELIP